MTLNPIKSLSKPEYLLRPGQVLRRLSRLGRPMPTKASVPLPWGAVFEVHTGENIGSDIYHYGVFDKIVPETIWRLLDAGETAVDVGANIGQNASAMAARAGRAGRVLAFEPHPEIFRELKTNLETSSHTNRAPVEFHCCALGQSDTDAWLSPGPEFSHNRGSAALQASGAAGQGIGVQVRRLDSFLDTVQQVGVCKIDVEGHELEVLSGAAATLARRGIRDIVFEDFQPQPSPVTAFLEQQGFALFELHDTWLKPRLLPLDVSQPVMRPGFSGNYLATLDAPRAVHRLKRPGWRCLLDL